MDSMSPVVTPEIPCKQCHLYAIYRGYLTISLCLKDLQNKNTQLYGIVINHYKDPYLPIWVCHAPFSKGFEKKNIAFAAWKIFQRTPNSAHLDVPGRKLGSMVSKWCKWVITILINGVFLGGEKNPLIRSPLILTNLPPGGIQATENPTLRLCPELLCLGGYANF